MIFRLDHRLVFPRPALSEPSGLLAHQERAERRIPIGFKRHARIGLGNPLPKNAGNSAIDIVHHKRWGPKVSHDILEQQLDGHRITGIARVPAHAMQPLQLFEDRFVRFPCRDADTHPAFRE